MTARSSPPVLLPAPVDLIAVASGGCQVILAWTECRAGGLGFRIERATCHSPCKPFVEIGKVKWYVTAFSDRSADPRTTYHYRVRAWNASGASLPSNVVEVTTLQAEMEPPADKE
jgi:hypothetical protein